MFEIVEREHDVSYQVPEIKFTGYEDYKLQATEIGSYIRSLSVTPENVKDVKSTLAKARKVTERLNRVRIDIKKEILANYQIFESQVKEITDIIDGADSELREKVRVLDQMERDAKLEEIKILWNKRISQYEQIQKYIPDAFDRWSNPKHLNKTVTMKTIEADMTAWMKETDKNLGTAALMGDDYLYEYARIGDLGQAIDNVKDREAWAAEHAEEELEELTAADPVATFTIIGKKDIALTERLLNENEIAYIKK